MEENFLIRDIFNEEVVRKIGNAVARVHKKFDVDAYTTEVMQKLNDLSFSERNDMITVTMASHLPQDYTKAVNILVKALPPDQKKDDITGFEEFLILPFTSYVARYGLEHFELSMHALYEMTKRFTAESAVRPFIQRYPKEAMSLIEQWSRDPHPLVRRLASEGTRPRLPWAMQLKEFMKDPRPVIKILDNLKADPVETVRRSVANNINDIGKDNPDLAVATLRRWSKTKDKGTQWIIRHASRSLVKDGNNEALELLGYPTDPKIEITGFRLSAESVKLNESISFSFAVTSHEKKPVNLMIDYVLHFMKANGKTAPKVFKLSQKTLQPGETIELKKSQHFKPLTTRKLYAGEHAVELQVNGRRHQRLSFRLVMK